QRRARSYSRSPSTSTSPVSESRNSSTARASLRAPIHHGHRPRLIGGCTDECELGARGKQWLPSPKRSRTHIEAVLLYQAVLDERLRGTNAPVEQQILPRLVLELGEPLNEIAIAGNEELLTVRPLQCFGARRDDDLVHVVHQLAEFGLVVRSIRIRGHLRPVLRHALVDAMPDDGRGRTLGNRKERLSHHGDLDYPIHLVVGTGYEPINCDHHLQNDFP